MLRRTKKIKNKSILKKEKKGRFSLDAETKNGIFVVLFFIGALLSILSYFKAAGVFGVYFLKAFRFLFGWGYFLVPVILILGGIAILKSLHRKFHLTTFLAVAFFAVSLLGIFHLVGKGGGFLGKTINYPLGRVFGTYGAPVILFGILLISFLVAFNISLAKLWPQKKIENQEQKDQISEKTQLLEEKQTGFFSKIKAFSQSRPQLEVKELSEKQEKKPPSGEQDFAIKMKMNAGSFKLPPLDLLEEDTGKPTSGDIKANANIIKRTLANFGIDVEMAEINIGPTVTQYTFRPAQGIKLSKITALHNDLSLALAAHPIRIEAPIPGRSLVGIEIPNKAVMKVRLRNILSQPEFAGNHNFLTVGVGRDVAGNCVFADLERMPHLLIAGATGTGKTICLNIIILSLLYRHSPEFLRFILIDPKRVEFPVYEGLPHLLTPVLVESEKTVNALRWAVGEMERRFEVLSKAGARDILAYNSRYGAQEPMPFIAIIIDELADLMASHGREIEATIVRLAQMARAVGIHLILATQRPSVEVITGLIKANITSRIAFQVASQVDSRTILDMSGAEKLLGNGDMLFLSGDAAKPKRVQGTYVSDKEVKRVAEFLKSEAKPKYDEEIIKKESKEQLGAWGSQDGGEEVDDDLYGQAKKIVIESGKASASLLQRRLRIGYARAARLLDILEENGIVGPADGAKPRQVYVEDERKKEFYDVH